MCPRIQMNALTVIWWRGDAAGVVSGGTKGKDVWASAGVTKVEAADVTRETKIWLNNPWSVTFSWMEIATPSPE